MNSSSVATQDDRLFAELVKRAVATPGSKIDLGTRELHVTKPVVIDSLDYLCLNFQGSGLWHQVTYTGPPGSTWLTVRNLKDSQWNGLGIRATVPGTSGVKILSTGSSGRNRFSQLHFQGFETGLMFDGPDSADVSETLLQGIQFTECKTGLKIVGDNALGFGIDRVVGADVGTLMDFLGGSGSRLTGCGGSDLGVMVRCRAGFPMYVSGSETERTKTAVYWFGGDGYDGAGQDMRLVIGPDMDHRAICDGGYLAILEKAGHTRLELLAHADSPPPKVYLNNLSDKQGVFEGVGDMAVKASGLWKVNGKDQTSD